MLDDLTSDSSTPQARSDLVVRDIDGGVVAWSPDAPEPVVLQPLAATMLQLLDGEVSSAELVADLADVLDVDDDVARNVLRHELGRLDGAGLLTTSPRSGSGGTEVFPAPPNP